MCTRRHREKEEVATAASRLAATRKIRD